MSMWERITAKLRALFGPPRCPPRMDQPELAEVCATGWWQECEWVEHETFEYSLP